VTPDQATSIALFYFRAGEQPLGVVASAVERVAPAPQLDGDPAPYPHVGALLKLPGTRETTDRRLVVLACAGRLARLIVDGPIRLSRVSRRELWPLGLGLRRSALVGFARDGEQLVLLLHLAWLVDRACRV
jgi:hypothetical protein